MNSTFKIKNFFIFLLIFLFFIFEIKANNNSFEIFLSNRIINRDKKYWVGEKYKINIKKPSNYIDENLHFRISNNKNAELFKNQLFMKSSGKECLYAFNKNNNLSFCFNIFNTPELKFKEMNPIKLETNTSKELKIEISDYPKQYIKFKSNHPDIVEVNNQGKIIAIRPGSAKIMAYGLDDRSFEIKVLSISNNGLINKEILNEFNASLFNNLMIVAHPDDETLWGGAHLFNEKFFVVCLTLGYKSARANDFREILKFTNNSGIILNYPDTQDFIRDNWSRVETGILKDIFIILSYKSWSKIVTHGPDGTTGHFHHKKICQYVTKIAQKLNKFDNLYYFGKFYKKKEIPKNLTRISQRDLENKKKLVALYKSVNITMKILFHTLPFENWILASKWKKFKI